MTQSNVGLQAKEGHVFAPRIQAINVSLVCVGMAITIVGIIALLNLLEVRDTTANTRDRYEESVAAATELMEASDYLTTSSRMYVVTGNVAYMDGYINEVENVRRRDHAVSILRNNASASEARKNLDAALNSSNRLCDLEYYAMRLVAEARGLDAYPKQIASVEISQSDEALSAEQKRAKAVDLVFGNVYQGMKDPIIRHVEKCSSELSEDIMAEREESFAQEKRLQTTLLVVLISDLALLAVAATGMHIFMIRPIRKHEKSIQNNESLKIMGSREIRNVAAAYNGLYAENLRRTALLKRQAETDGLTGVLNRGSFERLLEHYNEDVALIIVDIDYFKRVNDGHGHEVGDEVLKKVANLLVRSFRTTDYVCRIGGDEFAVLLTDMKSEMRSVVTQKIKVILVELGDESDSLPKTTLSLGIAFSTSLPSNVSLYHAADKALYDAKHRGRNGFVFYEAE